MRDKKNIDRLFQEKFKEFKATPSNSVWENISTELQNIGKGKKGIPIWWRVAGVAASLLLLFTIGQLVLNNNTTVPSQETIVDVDSKEDLINKDLEDVNNKENTVANSKQKNDSLDIQSEASGFPSNSSINNKVATSEQNEKTDKYTNVTVNNNDKNDTINTSNINKKEYVTSSNQTNNTFVDNKSNILQEKDQINTNDKIKSDQILNNINNYDKETTSVGVNLTSYSVNLKTFGPLETNVIVKDEKLSLTEVIAANDNENIEDNIPAEAFKRWKVASNIGPVYFNTFGKGSSIHPQFNNNSKTGNTNISYGITGSYAINKKLSVRSGINKVNLGYSTNDIVVYYNLYTVSTNEELLRNIDLNEKNQNLSFISIDEFNFAQVPSVLNDFIESSIDQKLGFIEIPLELEYRISNKKMGVNIIGGFSTLFLTDNEVYSVLNGDSTLLGKATNINNTSFTANFGVGFDFKISDKIDLNFEPVFKYQLNTFNDTSGDFNPFIIGIYSGLSFKF